MPDIELLMEAWPPEVEEILDNVNLLTPELDIPLEDYARMVSEPQVPRLYETFSTGKSLSPHETNVRWAWFGPAFECLVSFPLSCGTLNDTTKRFRSIQPPTVMRLGAFP